MMQSTVYGRSFFSVKNRLGIKSMLPMMAATAMAMEGIYRFFNCLSWIKSFLKMIANCNNKLDTPW